MSCHRSQRKWMDSLQCLRNKTTWAVEVTDEVRLQCMCYGGSHDDNDWRVSMSKLLLTACAFGLLSSSAFAQDTSPDAQDTSPEQLREGLRKQQATRVVASSKNQRIGFFTSVDPDCASNGEVEVRVTKQPEHGSAETRTATNFPNFSKENIRSKCNDRKVRGVQINYKSAEKYVGSDELAVCGKS
jgi:hypothetical protein